MKVKLDVKNAQSSRETGRWITIPLLYEDYTEIAKEPFQLRCAITRWFMEELTAKDLRVERVLEATKLPNTGLYLVVDAGEVATIGDVEKLKKKLTLCFQSYVAPLISQYQNDKIACHYALTALQSHGG